MVKDSRDCAYLAAKSSTYALQFPMPQNLTGLARNSKEECDCQKVIKSKSQSDREKY